MKRTPEPELMDGTDQARAYARADFDAVNQAFVEAFLDTAALLPGARIVDLGCGPADICVRIARARPDVHLTAVDGAPAMLAEARRAVADAGVADRVELVESLVPASEHGLEVGRFDAVISNSLLHHLHEPDLLWRDVVALGRSGAVVFVADLRRPPDEAAARALLDQYAAGEPDVLRRDFLASLHAAFEPDEVRVQLAAHTELADLEVEPIGDRHLYVRGRLR